MTLLIENIAGVELSPEAEQVLRRIFARYKRALITREFHAGLSGSRVFEVRPVKADGTPELPTVVKVATTSMIRQEWRAYQEHIHNRLPHAASVTSRPTLVAGTGWGGLRYPMMGSTTSEVVSLAQYVAMPDVNAAQLQVALERLMRIMDHVWGFNAATHDFAYRASYDAVLPPDLVLTPVDHPYRPVMSISPACLPAATPQPGHLVRVLGFAVRKVDARRRTVTLRLPPGNAAAFTVRLMLPEGTPLPDHCAGERVDLPVCRVIETRVSRLHAELADLAPGVDPEAPAVELAPGVWLPNPLAGLDVLLRQPRSVHTATVHGDFNLENILIEPQWGDISLIDFAEARQDHVLHDLLHLEAEVISKLLPEVVQRQRLDPLLLLADLSQRLHRVLQNPADASEPPAHGAVAKPWAILRAVRIAARRYLADERDLGEYYQGLTLYLLGTLRFRSLSQRPDHPLPKRLAFYAAALAYQQLLHGTSGPPALETLLRTLEAPVNGFGKGGATQPAGSPRFSDTLPVRGALPAGSRMLLGPNPRFVGRQGELAQLARLIWDRAPGAGATGSHAVAVVGLGGIGKTQLAVEFAHRFGRFFEGGVYWISCADPAAVPGEIASCGAREAMNLRAHYAELTLEEQVRLVLTEWERPAPRLLIFDNCESPEILARWRPPAGGGHILITSRRPDWEATAGVPVLALDVLRRVESVALLRSHQPDEDGAVLEAIAGELGDLPLAIHLAGSYLTRYRHTTDARGYLAGIRLSSPLRHQSLQRGPLLPTEHDVHVARTFAVSYDQLGRDEPSVRLARTLIHCMSCAAPGEPIPDGLLRLAIAADGDAVAAVRSGVYLGGAISQLTELGLVGVGSQRTLIVHRLVRAFTRDRLGDRIAQVQTVVEHALCEEAERINARREPAALREWQVHLRFLADAALPRADTRSADLCHALAEHLYQIGDYRGACHYFEHALEIRRETLGSSHPATARSLTQLGKALGYAGASARARRCLEQALAVQRAALGDHGDTATTLNHLGFLYQTAGELDAALECHTEALRIRRRTHGAGHPSLVDSLSNLAYVDYARGNLDAAYDLLRKALAVQRAASGPDHHETARVLGNLGELLLAKEQLSEAEEVLGEALAIQRRALGADHPETARTLGTLGTAWRLAGETERARDCYERALSVFLVFHGAEHPRTTWLRGELEAITPGSSEADTSTFRRWRGRSGGAGLPAAAPRTGEEQGGQREAEAGPDDNRAVGDRQHEGRHPEREEQQAEEAVAPRSTHQPSP